MITLEEERGGADLGHLKAGPRRNSFDFVCSIIAAWVIVIVVLWLGFVMRKFLEKIPIMS